MRFIRLIVLAFIVAPILHAEECGQPDTSTPCMSWDKPAKVMFWTVTALNAADYGSTRWALANGATEANPIMGGLVNHEPAFAVVKLGFGTAAAYLIYRSMRDQRKSFRWMGLVEGVAVVGLYVWVVKHNIGVVHELKDIQQGRIR